MLGNRTVLPSQKFSGNMRANGNWNRGLLMIKTNGQMHVVACNQTCKLQWMAGQVQIKDGHQDFRMQRLSGSDTKTLKDQWALPQSQVKIREEDISARAYSRQPAHKQEEVCDHGKQLQLVIGSSFLQGTQGGLVQSKITLEVKHSYFFKKTGMLAYICIHLF